MSKAKPSGPRVVFQHQTQKRRKPRRRPVARAPQLTIPQILAWADDFHERTGRWPVGTSKRRIPGSIGEKWRNVDQALRQGCRGLEPGSSLARLLEEHRGVRNHSHLPPFSVEGILRWADAHYQRTGCWPNDRSGPIAEAPGETWRAVEASLRAGCRGLPSGSSLARLLETHRGVRNIDNLPALTDEQILTWVDAYYRRQGEWPHAFSGPIPEAPGETWSVVESALRNGRRGLPGGSSLARLLAQHRGVRNHADQPRLTVEQILAWADSHHQRTGAWPTTRSGPVHEAPGETWQRISRSLRDGDRGLPSGSSLARLLARHRGVRHWQEPAAFTEGQILEWADTHFRHTGRWPKRDSGPIQDAPGETWSAVDTALRAGTRGLPQGGSSLPRLLAKHRGVRNGMDLFKFTTAQILSWADAYHQQTGRWPKAESGPIEGAVGTTWMAVERALCTGHRGLPGGSSLAQLLRAHGRTENRAD